MEVDMIHSTALIGTAPFSFDEDGKRKDAPYPVDIGKNVEIGPFTEVHNGRSGITLIGDNVKIAGHCRIGNSVIIGENTQIVSGVMIAARCKIGRNVRIHQGALIRQGVKIGNDAQVGMGAVVLENVPDGVTVVGNPAHPLRYLRPCEVCGNRPARKTDGIWVWYECCVRRSLKMGDAEAARRAWNDLLL